MLAKFNSNSVLHGQKQVSHLVQEKVHWLLQSLPEVSHGSRFSANVALNQQLDSSESN